MSLSLGAGHLSSAKIGFYAEQVIPDDTPHETKDFVGNMMPSFSDWCLKIDCRTAISEVSINPPTQRSGSRWDVLQRSDSLWRHDQEHDLQRPREHRARQDLAVSGVKGRKTNDV